MKGQHLFVRPIEPADQETLQGFFAKHSASPPLGTSGLLGKLVGDLAAVLIMDVTSSFVRIEQLFVAPELRKKRIGRVMIEELVSLAVKIDRPLLVVEDCGGVDGFFERVGFTAEGGRYVRRAIVGS